MPLLEEGVSSVLCLLAAISIWVLQTITQVIENAQKPPHFRTLNLTPHINSGAMQPVSESPDLSLYDARRADYRRGVKNCGTGRNLLYCGCILARMTKEILHPVPVGIVPR